MSDADSYLQNNLMCEAVDTGPYSPVRGVQARIHPIIAEWAANFLQSVSVSGSFIKGTANKDADRAAYTGTKPKQGWKKLLRGTITGPRRYSRGGV